MDLFFTGLYVGLGWIASGLIFIAAFVTIVLLVAVMVGVVSGLRGK